MSEPTVAALLERLADMKEQLRLERERKDEDEYWRAGFDVCQLLHEARMRELTDKKQLPWLRIAALSNEIEALRTHLSIMGPQGIGPCACRFDYRELPPRALSTCSLHAK